MAAAVLAVAVIGLCGVIGAAHQNAAAGEERSAAWMLARELMEEISSQPFAGLDGYHGYSDSTSALAMGDGTVIELGGPAFTREVTVQYRATASGPPVPAGDFAVVTIMVRGPSGQTATMRQLYVNVELRR